jgi:ribose/xylose/arabinose/galactoside ABC-type transport system permease subunit
MKNLILLAILVSEVVVILSIGAERLSLELGAEVAEQSGRLVFLAFGMTLVLMTAGIDLSVASMTVLITCVVGSLFDGSFGIWVLPFALVMGLSLGLFNGVLVARFDVPPIIATLGTLFLFRGCCWVVVGERTSIPFDKDAWAFFGEWPFICVAAVVFYGLGGLLLSRSRWLEEILMIGGNRVAARYAGIRVTRRLLEVYALVGVLAALTSLVFIGRNGSVQASSFKGLELQVIVATVLGGTRVQGGVGSVVGTLLGVVIVTVMSIGLRGLEFSSIQLPFKEHYLRYLLLGGLLVIGVWLNTHGRWTFPWRRNQRE